MLKIRMAVPKGRIFEKVVDLLSESGIYIKKSARSYRPIVNDMQLEIKILKPQNIAKLVEYGSHDVGFTGLDWIEETGADVVKLMDLGFDPVKIVSAKPKELPEEELYNKKIVVASEYENISKKYLNSKKMNYVFLRTFGATEVFPPDDADMIIDNTSTGSTLREHNLEIVDVIMESSTYLIANKESLENKEKREHIEELEMIFKSILDARKRVMLEMNVPKDKLDTIVDFLPCMRAPTVSPLFGEQGYAVKTAVLKTEVRKIIPKLKKLGATDILEYELKKVII